MRLINFSLSAGKQLYKTLSDPSRIRIINLIYHFNEMCITDLELVLDYTQTKVSRHLIYMKNSGVTGFKKSDQFTFYYINEELLDIVGQQLKYMERDPVLNRDVELYKELFGKKELSASKLNRGK
jgi:DNA-binding transcriptional ArsR family regulator